MANKHLVVLYGIGGLSDVGRHAVEVVLREYPGCGLTVLTQHPELIKECNWNCGCTDGHSIVEDPNKWKIFKVDRWDDPELSKHLSSCDAVISCLGNRQPTLMDVPTSSWCAAEGNAFVIRAMQEHGIQRVVVCSSMGIEEDWPPLEFHWAGKIMSCLFVTLARGPFRDLTKMEQQYKATTGLDWLFVRPLGLGEDVVPKNRWKLQTEKYKDTDLSVDLAKMDAARYMVQEALNPTRHCEGVVIGGVKE